DRRQLLIFFALSAMYWLVNGAGMALLGLAFAGTGPSGDFHLSVFQAYVVMCVLVVGVMIPAAPGMVGTFQAAVMTGLLPFRPEAVVQSAGLAYANVLWLCQTAQQVGYGLILMVTGHLSFREITRNLSAEDSASSEPAGAAAPAGEGSAPGATSAAS